MPGHVTTSAFVVSPDLAQVLLIPPSHHRALAQARWTLEPAAGFAASAAREAVEETTVQGSSGSRPWHAGGDLPLVIDNHEVPVTLARREADHYRSAVPVHLADPALPLVAQEGGFTARGGFRWMPLRTSRRAVWRGSWDVNRRGCDLPSP
ncbi:MAG: hypothetical protein IPK28_10905 [Devosia sp.]|nr:hypothetical protein [Devosia sp.]